MGSSPIISSKLRIMDFRDSEFFAGVVQWQNISFPS